MRWSPSLVREIADRRCIIFLGAGASSTSKGDGGKKPPSWKDFLEDAVRELNLTDDIKRLSQEKIDSMDYLNAAELIFSDINIPDSKDFFRQHFLTPRYTPSELHKIVHELDAKIVIQTNYDVIYEKECGPIDGENGYVVKRYYDENTLDDIRSPNRVIIKAHGCVKEPERLVLTRSQYFNTKSQHQNFYHLLDGLFLTHTILFIGCSLTDPDIQLILENTNISIKCAHPHYALMPSGEHSSIVNAIQKAYNIRYIEYDNTNNDYSKFIPALDVLRNEVIALRSTVPS